MSCGDIGRGDEPMAVEGLALRDRLECDYDVVGCSEFEGVDAQVFLFFYLSVALDALWSTRAVYQYWYDHTLLQLQRKRIVLVTNTWDERKSLVLKGDGSDVLGKAFIVRDLVFQNRSVIRFAARPLVAGLVTFR